ncbi:MAG: acyl-CoA thioesterase [Salibacteraceae bacterium]
MFETEHRLRVRYSETDKMGFVYYGHYATYFEVARVEALRELGIRYADLEDRGIILPVAEYKVRYHKPAHYDEEIRIVTRVNGLPRASIVFHYKAFNARNDLLTTATTVLVFVDAASRRPMRAPDDVLEAMRKHNLS